MTENPMKIIALEESFWYDKLTTEGNTVSHVRIKSAVATDRRRKLVDFTEYRLPDMDRNGVGMQVLSPISPGIQVQPEPEVVPLGLCRAAGRPAAPLCLVSGSACC
jgi:2,3-dihydroxybenzoate decarboxylase